MTDFSPKVRALSAHLDVNYDTISECKYDDNMFESTDEPGEYLVLTESEREQAADEALENYIDECILPGVPESFRNYFDREAWKRDALMSDGYGHTLAYYDGNEDECQIDGEWYYIYRVN
jgi:hypothetical protein